MEDEFSTLVLTESPELSESHREILEKQNSRGLISEFKAKKLEEEAGKNWDLFYKRNDTRFFKDRLWTTREFNELLDDVDTAERSSRKFMLEVGCGVGNLVFPLIENECNDFFIFACDFSPRAIEFVKANKLYNDTKMKAFTADITKEEILNEIPAESLDIITMVFVLSAIHPENFEKVAATMFKLLNPNGLLLFRDYGLYDMAQLRFKPGNKLADNFYMRQDGTRSYFFSLDETKTIFDNAGFDILQNNFIERRTINKKENINVQRWFLQGKYRKPLS